MCTVRSAWGRKQAVGTGSSTIFFFWGGGGGAAGGTLPTLKRSLANRSLARGVHAAQRTRHPGQGH